MKSRRFFCHFFCYVQRTNNRATFCVKEDAVLSTHQSVENDLFLSWLQHKTILLLVKTFSNRETQGLTFRRYQALSQSACMYVATAANFPLLSVNFSSLKKCKSQLSNDLLTGSTTFQISAKHYTLKCKYWCPSPSRDCLSNRHLHFTNSVESRQLSLPKGFIC